MGSAFSFEPGYSGSISSFGHYFVLSLLSDLDRGVK